jgi:ubiquinone/menaquinone biosynthesis C-methylase UbiE
MSQETHPPICDYEGSDYQTRFWDKGGRQYEDRCEAIALQRLLPKEGHLLLELGAGAGRNTSRYNGFDRVVLLDYSRTQLRQAQEHLGYSDRYVYVAADIYRLPFVEDLFDTATMIRVIHHMADAPAALRQVHSVLQPGGVFILEFANKQNWKAILRFLFRKQNWNPFKLEPVEFMPLNFDFHPKAIKNYLRETGFQEDKVLTVSHFRIELLKKIFPTSLLVNLDSIFQWTGSFMRFTPSIFVSAKEIQKKRSIKSLSKDIMAYFKCPHCEHTPLSRTETKILCDNCLQYWKIVDGIIDFRGDKE